MNTRDLCRTIDPAKLDFSLLVVTPKLTFIEWLETFAQKKGIGGYRIHIPEEDSVWLIPRIERFSESGSYDDFLSEMKPRMLTAELYNFGAAEVDFGHPVSKETFDWFFNVTLRTAAFSISVLLQS